jgi:diadenosine tetraphosphatase ApaH/serine/threonine PP2A family protein phosphatase
LIIEQSEHAMRYAIFSDIHANMEALEAVLAKIDELAQEQPIDQIWFLGDLVGYGPDPNECIVKLREHTDVMIAGNHDWAAIGKIDLEDFSAAARISAEWTADQLTEEHREFLANLPERLEIGECTLVHGSPYGPLWEYLTSEILAERSFQYFSTHYCLVGHTHVPVIFQQPDSFSNAPTLPLQRDEPVTALVQPDGIEHHANGNDDETAEKVAVQQATHSVKVTGSNESAFTEPESGSSTIEELTPPEQEEVPATEINTIQEQGDVIPEDDISSEEETSLPAQTAPAEEKPTTITAEATAVEADVIEPIDTLQDKDVTGEPVAQSVESNAQHIEAPIDTEQVGDDAGNREEISLEPLTASTEDPLSSEIEELLTLLGLSQSMIQVSNEMITPPEGHWEAAAGCRAIINPGGVGQPRDGDPRAAFMIYDTERGIEFYRVPYPFEKTQEKIIKAGLPQYLAVRLAYGR